MKVNRLYQLTVDEKRTSCDRKNIHYIKNSLIHDAHTKYEPYHIIKNDG